MKCLWLPATLALISSFSVQAVSEIELNRYTSLAGWNVNSYWIESEKSVVLIDAQLINKDAERIAAQIKLTNKPLKAVIVTHPHPDHIAGLTVLKKQFPDMDIINSANAEPLMQPAMDRFVKNGMAKQWADQVEINIPKSTKFVADKTTLVIDGVEYLFHDMGPAEAEAHLLIEVPSKKWLFTGDATMHNAHYYVGEGRSALSLDMFNRIEKNFAGYRLYAGHGEPANSSILITHKKYVSELRNLVMVAIQKADNLESNGKRLKALVRDQLAKEIEQKYPDFLDYGFEAIDIIRWNLMGIEYELLNTIDKA